MGTILDIECTLKDVSIDSEGLIGKNWFDTFIDDRKKENIYNVHKVIFDANNQRLKLYQNEIRCPDGTYRCLDFLNTVKYIDNKKVVESFGVEDMEAYS